jgi:ribonuclease P protein subunit RPR2
VIRVLICDDAAEARAAIRTMLGGHPQIQIVGEAGDGREAIERAVELHPDVVLMDVGMPVLDGVEATRRITELFPATRIVAFAGSTDSEVVQAMLEAGASSYCVKGAPLWELERAIAGVSEPLVRLAHLLARTPGIGVGALATRELAELSGASAAAAYVSAPDGLVLAGSAGPAAGEGLDEVPGVVRRAFAGAQPARAEARELAELLRLTDAAFGDALAMPLLADGEVLGVVMVAMPASVQHDVDPELVAAVADLAGAALANQRRLALTHAEARRDALTGLPNRRAFDEHLGEALAWAREHDREVALVLLDLDDFKQVNDRDGHAVGDQVLREVARVMLRSLRADEEAFRIGGEEFALVVKGDSTAAARLAERVRLGLEGQRRGHRLPTFSAGVACFPRDGATVDELAREADMGLYSAKQTGKNRVVVCGQGPVSRGQRPLTLELPTPPALERGVRVLVVDDDPGLRMLLRTTFEIIDIAVEEAGSARSARMRIAERRPDVVVLDIAMPGMDGLAFCRELKGDPATRDVPVVLLSGAGHGLERVAREVGADAFLQKPFSPLELLEVIERTAGGLYEGPFRMVAEARPEEQLLLYAQDLRRLLEAERKQRLLLQNAYRETVSALTGALETKDFGTGAHSQRVRRYAREITKAVDASLLSDPSLEYGFVLHDVGKIGIPDRILQKPGPLTEPERRIMESHVLRGEELLGDVALLRGEGLRVIRSHHERWDGLGYPDGLRGDEIPLGGRIFAVADTLDAMTSDRPYRPARNWDDAVRVILGESRRQFDPDVVAAFRECEPKLRRIGHESRQSATRSGPAQ